MQPKVTGTRNAGSNVIKKKEKCDENLIIAYCIWGSDFT